jgi:diguanylate cyclase (GGDEF)-like protein
LINYLTYQFPTTDHRSPITDMKRCSYCGQEYPQETVLCPYDGYGLDQGGDDLLLGQVLEGKYRLEKCIGTGGMATVYLAKRLQLGDEVAVKILNAESLKNPLAVARFRREAQASARIKHRSVVTIHDLGNLPEGNTFLVMEYIRGFSLRDELREKQVLSVDRAVNLISDVCEAVQAAHDAGIIHRDLKPENIMIEPQRNGTELVKVVDFGVAELREHVISDALTKITEAGMMVGTPYYISPEQCRGLQLDVRSDIYSLGIILFEILTGNVPFRGKTLSAVIIQHATERPPSIREVRTDVSDVIEAVIYRALSKDRAHRPSSAIQFAQELEYALSGTPPNEASSTIKPRTGPFSLPDRSKITGSLNTTTRRGTGGHSIRKSGSLNYDSLTGLHSYTYFIRRLEETLTRCSQAGESLAVAIFGIDRFKRINDSYGYLMGDMALREVGQLIFEQIPEEATLSRASGDGFVMMISGKPSSEVMSLIESLGKLVAETKFLTKEVPEGIALSISAGVAIFPKDSLASAQLIEAAQRALRQAKMRGTGQIVRSNKDKPGEQTEPQICFDSFVGRKQEIEKLHHEFEQVVAGRGRPLLVTGDAGMGKTKLVDEFHRRLVGKDVLFLQGRFYESGSGVPYKVYCDSLRGSIHYLIEHSPEEVEKIFGPLTERVLKDFGDSDPLSLLRTGDGTYGGTAEQEKYRIFDYLTRIYISLSRLRPVMLFLDDLHWSDELSLDFLSYLLRASSVERIFIVAAMREWEASNESNPVRGWLRQMSRSGNYEQIKLSPLSQSELTSVVGLMFGSINISQPMLELLCGETKGNPFYLVEIIQLLLEEKVIGWRQESWHCKEVSEIRLPTSIIDLVEARLAKMPEKALDVFTQAAVIGDEFSFDLLEAVTEMDEDELLQIIEAGLREYILKEESGAREDRYSFCHSTVRKVLYERTSRRRRKRLHQQVGTKMEEIYADRANKIAAELVYHYYNAEDYEHALRYAVEAGNLAWRALAISEAARYYEWAEKSIQSLTASLKEEVAGQSTGSSQILQLAACGLHLEADRMAQYHLNYGRLFMQLGKHKRAETELRQTLEFARQMRSLQLVGRAFTALGELYRQYGQLTRGLEYGEQGLAVLSSIEDCEWEVEAMMVIGASHDGLGHFNGAIENYQGALALARKLSDKVSEGNALSGLGFTFYRLGQYEKAQESARRALEITTAISDRLGQERCLNLLGTVLLEIGHYREALKQFEQALKIARDMNYKPRETTILNNIGECYRRQARFQEANNCYLQALSITRETMARGVEGTILLNIGLLHQSQSDHEKALAELIKARHIARETGARPTELEVIVGIADSLRSLNRIEEASETYQQALDQSRQSGSPVFEWRALYGLARCERMRGNKQAALKLLGKSVEVIEMMSTELKTYNSRVSFLKNKQNVYNDLAELSQEMDKEEL